MISIVITSFNEPIPVKRAIQAILDNKIKEKYELIVAAPDKETEEVVKQFSKKNKKINNDLSISPNSVDNNIKTIEITTNKIRYDKSLY